MLHSFFFQIAVTDEQIALADALVEYSIKHHPVTDIFAHDPQGNTRQRAFRQTGTLGEILFADVYGLPRPTRAFGAIDGQDFGQDFVVELHGQPQSFDIKTMRRQNNRFRTNYVLNLPAYQMRRPTVVTDYYFCISIHAEGTALVASFLGYVAKRDIEAGSIGTLYTAGTTRTKDDGNTFIFQRDTYEVDFKDISSPFSPAAVEHLPTLKRKQLLPAFQKKNGA